MSIDQLYERDDKALYSCISISNGFNSSILIARRNIDPHNYRVHMLNILYCTTNRQIGKEFCAKNRRNVSSLRAHYGSDSAHAVDGTQGCWLRVRISLGTCISSGALQTKGSQHILYVILLHSVLFLLNLPFLLNNTLYLSVTDTKSGIYKPLLKGRINKLPINCGLN